LIPRKIAGNAIRTIEPSSADMNTAAVVLVRAIHLYRSLIGAWASAGASARSSRGGVVIRGSGPIVR
jgi:hypothetical protein